MNPAITTSSSAALASSHTLSLSIRIAIRTPALSSHPARYLTDAPPPPSFTQCPGPKSPVTDPQSPFPIPHSRVASPQSPITGGRRVIAASAYPINSPASPTYQRLYTQPSSPDPRLPAEMDPDAATADAAIEAAVAEATEQLHDDMAYEFEMRWQLWAAEPPDVTRAGLGLAPPAEPDEESDDEHADAPNLLDPDSPWRLRTHTVRILGFGPLFDVAGYEQNGHILVDFGLDTPWLLDTPIDRN